MKPFDPATYLKDVLGPYLDSTELPSLFERYCLQVEDDDDRAIEARLDKVKELWDKRIERPKYGPLVRLLIERHEEACLILGDPRERRREAAAAAREQSERAEASGRARKEWEALLQAAVKQHGGIDPTTRATLERAAQNLGLDAGFVSSRLDAVPAAAVQAVLSADQRRETRKALTSLAQDLGETRVGLNLFHALGLPGVTLDVAEIRARHGELDSENAKRRPGNTKVLYGTMLVITKRLLLDGDPRAYVEGLLLDVREQLAADGIRAAVDDGVIDELEAERLARRAVELGLTPELGQRVVAEVARENGVPLRTSAPVDYVACAACNHVHARDRASDRCERCGAELFMRCPDADCATVNDAAAARCRKCGADLRQFVAASRRLAGLGDLLRGGRLEQAREELAEIECILGGVPEVARRTRELDAALERARAAWSQAETAIAERRLYAARRSLQELRRTAVDLPGPEGPTAAERLSWVAERLAAAEAALRSAREAHGPAREAALVRALRIAADCREAEEELGHMPADPPTRVRAAIEGADMVVAWTASPTAGLSYEVTRVAADGARDLVSDAAQGARIVDAEIASGANVRYEVVAVRGRSRSTAAVSEPIVAARELQELAAFSGDGEVRLTWKPIGARGRVLVHRRNEGSGAQEELTPDSAGLVDCQVRNGERYAYHTRVEYAGPGGEAVLTKGATAFAQPSPRPEPVAIRAAQPSPPGVLMTFARPPSGTVTVIRCAGEPELAAGDELDPGRLDELGDLLAADGSGVRDPDPHTGSRWYLPVTVAGAMAVAGHPFRYLALPGVDNVRVLDGGGAVRVTWSWPAELRTVLVVWRQDRQPEGPDDPAAQRRSLRLGEYRDHGGFTIDAPGEAGVFVAVYPAARVDGEMVHGTVSSRASRAAFRRTPKTDVRYAVRRTGIRRKRLEIDVLTPPEGELPGMVVVARPGDLLPRDASDGDIVARLGGGEPHQSALDLSGRNRPLTVRVFLSSAGAEASHRLLDPNVEDLVIR